MALRQVFWSILDHMTYFRSGLKPANVKSAREIDIPVARGKTKTSETNS